MENRDSILDDIKVEEVPCPDLQTWMINLIDGVFVVVILVALYFLIPREAMNRLFAISALVKYILTLFIIFAYRLICILMFGRTLGMVIGRSKYLNSKLLPLTKKEKLTAVFLTIASAIKNYKV